jgi:hypothetical protein
MARQYVRKAVAMSPNQPKPQQLPPQVAADARAESSIEEARQSSKRTDAVRQERRRRRESSLNGMADLRLDIPPEFRDDPDYVYRWANDKGARIHNLTVAGDWDVVTKSGPEAGPHDSVRRPVGVDHSTGQPLEAQLLRKPRWIHEEDEADKMGRIADRETGLLQGAKSSPEDTRPESVSYAAPNNSIRRGAYRP